MAEDLDEGWWQEYRRVLEAASARSRWLCGSRRSGFSERIRKGRRRLPPADDGAKPACPGSDLLACPHYLRASVTSTNGTSLRPFLAIRPQLGHSSWLRQAGTRLWPTLPRP